MSKARRVVLENAGRLALIVSLVALKGCKRMPVQCTCLERNDIHSLRGPDAHHLVLLQATSAHGVELHRLPEPHLEHIAPRGPEDLARQLALEALVA